MKKNSLFIILIVILLSSCGTENSKQQKAKKNTSLEKNYQVKLITVDPGHFHAALVQKNMYSQISPEVHVYAPQGPDYQQHLFRIGSYNHRQVNPTSWNEIVYVGADFFEKMIAEKTGNVVVLSGNNRKKAEYISKSINAGLNVLADKPMIINPEDFPILENALERPQPSLMASSKIIAFRLTNAGIPSPHKTRRDSDNVVPPCKRVISISSEISVCLFVFIKRSRVQKKLPRGWLRIN